MDAPETLYDKSGDVHVAYQVFGDGGLDLVFLAEFWNSIEAMWEQTDYRHFLERLGSFARVICVDQRGTGSSDPVSLSDMLDVWTDDVMTIHTGARVAAEAAPGGVLVSSTGRDLVAGSGIAFEQPGPHTLKGVAEPRRLYTVVDA